MLSFGFRRRSTLLTMEDLAERRRRNPSRAERFDRTKRIAVPRLERKLRSNVRRGHSVLSSRTVEAELTEAVRKTGYLRVDAQLRKEVLEEIIRRNSCERLRLEINSLGGLRIYG